MSDLKPIALSNLNVEKMSRHELLEWVNNTVGGIYKKVEELSSGVAYCQMLEILFPNTLGIKKVKLTAKLETECLHNMKLLQNAFTRLKFDKTIPIDRLVKGRFQDNLEFLQWFKKFFDSQNTGKENCKALPNITVSTSDSESSQSNRKPKANAKKPKSSSSEESQPVSPSSLHALEDQRDRLLEETAALETERNYYYKKLTDIEAILNESNEKNENVEWCQRLLSVLYAEDDFPGEESEPN